MKEPMKNIAKGEALILKEQVDYQPGQVSARPWPRTTPSA